MGIRSFLSSSKTSRLAAVPRGLSAVRRAARAGLPSHLGLEPLEDRRLMAAHPSDFDLFVPSATLVAQAAPAAGATVGTVVVRYDDLIAIDSSSIDASDVQVVAPDGVTVLPVTSVTVAAASGDDSGKADRKAFDAKTSAVATYTFAAPGGAWDTADNGQYSVTVVAGAVANVTGAVTGALNTNGFAVDIPIVVVPPADTTAPAAVLAGPATITEADDKSAVVSVTYTDDVGINTASISSGNVVVKFGDTPLAVTKSKFKASDDGRTVTASYTVAAPGGSWDAADNGNYSVVLSSLFPVTDGAGNVAAGAGVGFAVAIATPVVPLPPVVPPPVVPPVPPAAAVPPVAAISPVVAVDKAAAASKTVTVTYTDDDGQVSAGTIGLSDLSVLDAAGNPVAVTGVSVQPSTDASKITAVYTITAPGGSWDSADNGTYTVNVKAGEVTDTAGNGVAAAAATFSVSVPVPAPVVDTSFSGGTPVNAGFVAEATTTTADGKLLIVGRQGDLTGGSSQYVIKRLNADGSVDGTFGNGGVVVSSLVTDNAAAFAVTLGQDGSIYVAGSKGGGFAVWKFKASGAADNKFGTRGEAAVDIGSSQDRAYGVAVGADGSVVAVGSAGTQYAVIKLTASGNLDAGMGVGGILVGNTTSASVLSSAAVMADGRIVAAGSIGSSVCVYRFLPNGFGDTSFGGNALVVVPALSARTDFGEADHTVGVALQGDAVLVASRVGTNFAVARLNTAGDLDLGFGTNGIAQVDFGGSDDADQVIVQGTGQILVVGTTEQTGQSSKIGIAVMNPDGSPDPTFGTNGQATVDTNSGGRALHIGNLVVRAFAAAQGNGQLVVGSGEAEPSSTPVNSGLRRLNVPGSGLLGTFGLINGKYRKLSFIDADGTRVTLSLKGGVGKALYDGSKVDIVLTGTSDASSLSIKTKGGDKLVAVRNLSADGGIKVVSAKAATVSGSFTVGGRLGKADLRGLEGTLAAAGGIGSLSVAGDLKNAIVLAGASLGADGVLGGDADSFAAGSIGSIKVGGAIRGTVIGAGVSTRNATLLDDDDTVVDPTNSVIGSLSARGGLDAASRVIAGHVGKAKLPKSVDVFTDARFEVSAFAK